MLAIGENRAYARKTALIWNGKGLVGQAGKASLDMTTGETGCDTRQLGFFHLHMGAPMSIQETADPLIEAGYSRELVYAWKITESLPPSDPANVTAFALVSIAHSLELIAMAIGNHENAEGMAGSLSGVCNAVQEIAWPAP